MFPRKPRKVLVRIRIILLDLLDDILADVGVVFFDLLRAVRTTSPINQISRSQSKIQSITPKYERYQVRRGTKGIYSHPQLIFRRNDSLLPPIPQQVQHKLGNISSSDGDVFDRGTDDVSVGDGDGVCPVPDPSQITLA